jgi:hypothetical protein
MTVSFVQAMNDDLFDGTPIFEATLAPCTTWIYGDRAERVQPGERIMYDHVGLDEYVGPQVAQVAHVRVGMYYGETGELGDGFYAAFITIKTGGKTGETIIMPVDREVMIVDAELSWDQNVLIDQYNSKGAIGPYGW